MDEEENHLSDTQTNNIFDNLLTEEIVKDWFDVSQTNDIFDNLLTESQFEEMVKYWFDESKPESDKEDGDDESSKENCYCTYFKFYTDWSRKDA